MGRHAGGGYLGVQGLKTLPFLPQTFRPGIFAHRDLDLLQHPQKGGNG